ncbi:MAG: apolipoprotein N-acyltransferase [Actinomycetia bacterium]|nr:apolipoprotein N-acyltransferase [Actinomycetes bacterium]MCP4961840.1 apolipoprotein N-acyltransferase [Actinomycetes bacterium]
MTSPTADDPPATGGRLRRLAPRLRMVAAGVLAAFALGPWGWWPLAIIGMAMTFDSVNQPIGRRERFVRVWWFMLGYYVLGVAFIIDLTIPGYLIAVPVLAAVMAAPHNIAGPAATRGMGFVAAIVVGEAWRWAFPFGGVPMGGFALGQVNGPLLPVASTLGALGVVAVAATLAVGVAHTYRRRPRQAGIHLIVVGLALVLAHVDADTTPNGSFTASSVQGGGSLGTNAETSDQAPVFTRHLEATSEAPNGSVVLWPESAVIVTGDFARSNKFERLAELAVEKDLTLIVGVTQKHDRTFDNLAVVISPTGHIVDEYQKVHLVPFGEYVPFRSFIAKFADLSLIPRDAAPGKGAGFLQTPNGPAAVGISVEIYFPERIRSGIVEGGEFIVNPTLASSYRTTHVPEQSLASARLRAVESGRWVLQSSTTGYTAIVDNTGKVIGRSGLKEKAIITADVEKRIGDTWATRLGKHPITLVSLITLAALALLHPRNNAARVKPRE